MPILGPRLYAKLHRGAAVVTGSDWFAELNLDPMHRIVAGLLPARNFYVATLSPDGSLLTFPYYIDEAVPPPPPRKRGYGLTEYVLHTGRAILTTADELTVLQREHHQYSPTGKPAALWMGAPLLVEGRAFGVIAVQDYKNPNAYNEEDKRLLTFVASQTAAAVQRRQVIAHVVPAGGAEWQRRIRFRDTLRADPGLARDYEQLKLRAAARTDDWTEYTGMKKAFVHRVLVMPTPDADVIES